MSLHSYIAIWTCVYACISTYTCVLYPILNQVSLYDRGVSCSFPLFNFHGYELR